jgi:Pentapeptide repeats (8 copies)
MMCAVLHAIAGGASNPRGAPLLCPSCDLGAVGDILAGQDLTDAYLFKASLLNVNLSGTNLTRANLTLAFLNGANLIGANLTGANLDHARLNNANLTNAILTGAHHNPANGGVPPDVTGVFWSNTACPDGTNSDRVGGTCEGHGL